MAAVALAFELWRNLFPVIWFSAGRPNIKNAGVRAAKYWKGPIPDSRRGIFHMAGVMDIRKVGSVDRDLP